MRMIRFSELLIPSLGDAEAILHRAKATAAGLAEVSESLANNKGRDAAGLRIAEQYVEVSIVFPDRRYVVHSLHVQQTKAGV